MPPVAMFLEVTGVADAHLDGQTLRNLWRPDLHAPAQRLAQVSFYCPDLRSDVLERITWSLLAWPGSSRIELYDVVSDVVAGTVTPMASKDAAGTCRWPGAWCHSAHGSEVVDRTGLPRPGGASFPPAAGGGLLQRSIGAWLRLDDHSQARRERLKRRISSLLGAAAGGQLYALLRRLAGRVSRPAKSCPAGQGVIEALSDPSLCSAGTDRDALGVVLVVPRLSPGGAEKSAIDLAVALVGLDVRAHIVTTFRSDNVWSERARSGGARVWHLPEFLAEGCWLAFLEALLRRESIDVLHISNSHWMYDHLGCLKARLPGLRVITQVHAEGEPGQLDFPALTAREDRLIDCHTVVSRHLGDLLCQRYNLVPEKLRLVRTGIDVAKTFSPTLFERGAWRRRHGLGDDARLVAFIGRFSQLKRPLLFLDVAGLVLQQRLQTRFVMMGEGPLRAAVETRIARSKALTDAVMLSDARESVGSLMRDADLLVVTSAMEGIAYVSYEAMALGLVQVSADVGGQSEVIGVDSGVLIPPGPTQCEEFARAICCLLDAPELRARMGKAARERIVQWPDVDAMARQYLELYRQLSEPQVLAGQDSENQAHGSTG